MVEAGVITKDPVKHAEAVTKRRRYQAGYAEVTTSETITTDVGTITASGHAVFKASDGSAVAHTVATSVITITEAALTDEPVYFIVVGAVP